MNNNGNKIVTKHRRTRSGCLCCRLRKKKCDGLRPTCVACERNVLICSWPTSNATRSLPSKKSSDVAGTTHRGRSIAPELSAAASGSTTSGSRNGCLISGPLTVANKWHGSISQQTGCETSTLPSPSSSLSNIRPEDELVYRNYVTRTANTLSTLHDVENPFINILMPMAASDNLILESILALSAAHLWKQPGCAAQAEYWMSTHETLAIRGLKYGLTRSSSSKTVDTSLIVSTLLLSLVETMKGESNLNAILHLRGSRTLLHQWISTQQATNDPKLRAFIIEAFLYLTISIGIPLGSEPHHSIAQDADILFPYVKAEGRCGPLLGCAHELFELIPQIHTLARTCSEGCRDINSSMETERAFQWILNKLLAWKPPEYARKDAISCAIVYQQALLVFLHTSMEEFILQPISTSCIIDQAFDVVIRQLDNLSFDARISTTLTWPLAVLGSSSNVPKHQDVVRGHLRHLSLNLHWAVFDQVLCVLETLWQDTSLPKGMRAFEIVMNRLKMYVLIS